MNPVADKVFMFTGRISVTRHEAQDIITELGAAAGGSVTKRTDYLVVGEDYGSKFTTAQILGVKCIDEDEFWAMVNEARKEQGLEVLLSREELEDFDSISVEKWQYVFSQNPKLKIVTEEGFIELTHTDKVVAVGRKYPPIESMSYYSKENLTRFLQDNPDIKPKLGKRVCPYCHYEIPYSISGAYWYCFKCKLFSDVGQDWGGHACVDWEKLDIETERGFYEKCKLCVNIKFVAFAEVEDNVKSALRCNFVHSLEFDAEIVEQWAEFDRIARELDELRAENWGYIQDGTASEEDLALYAKFVAREKRKEAATN